jgi:hypothetical protein
MLKYKLLMSFVLSMAALSNNVLAHENKEHTADSSKPSTFARFVPERKDDFAWENDLVAFRAYGPAARSGSENAGVDCWLKRVNYPVINKWYKQHLEQGMSYHKDHGEGLDNYHVGSSAGCGGTSLWLNNKRVPLETYTQWEIIEQTVARSVFILTYEHKVGEKQYKEEKKITIELGSRLYHVTSTFWVDGVIAPDLSIAVGLSTHDGKAVVKSNKKLGWLATWENIAHYGLGTAIIVEPHRIQSFKVIESNQVKDKGHVLYIVNTDDNGQIEYFSGYGWQKAKTITSVDKWHEYLNEFPAVYGIPPLQSLSN